MSCRIESIRTSGVFNPAGTATEYLIIHSKGAEIAMCKNYKTRLLSSALAILMLSGVVSPAVNVNADDIKPVQVVETETLSNSYNTYILDKSGFC